MIRTHSVELRQRPFDDVVLLERLQDLAFLVGQPVAERRIQHLLLDGSVHRQRFDHVGDDCGLRLQRTRPERLEPCKLRFDCLVVSLQ